MKCRNQFILEQFTLSRNTGTLSMKGAHSKLMTIFDLSAALWMAGF